MANPKRTGALFSKRSAAGTIGLGQPVFVHVERPGMLAAANRQHLAEPRFHVGMEGRVHLDSVADDQVIHLQRIGGDPDLGPGIEASDRDRIHVRYNRCAHRRLGNAKFGQHSDLALCRRAAV